VNRLLFSKKESKIKPLFASSREAKMPNQSPQSTGSRIIGPASGALVLFFLILGAWIVYTLKLLLIDVLLAITLASALAPVAEKLEQKKIPRVLTVLAAYLLFLLIYVGITIGLAPALWEQGLALYHHLPGYLAKLMEWYNELRLVTGDQASAVSVGADDIRSVALGLVDQTLNLTAGIVGFLLNGILILFLTAYFVVEAPIIWPNLLKWLPQSRRERFGKLIRPVGSRMGGYVRGQLMVSLAVAIFLGTGLTLIGVKYSLILGVMAGLLNLMPFVGSMLTAAFAILVALNQSVVLAAMTVALFAIEQWCESNFIVPHLLGSQVELHPIIVLFAIIIGATIMGVPGALVAVPTTSAAVYLAQEFYLKPLNEDPDTN
jgi:predicted PurR-regulated permease PerM